MRVEHDGVATHGESLGGALHLQFLEHQLRWAHGNVANVDGVVALKASASHLLVVVSQGLNLKRCFKEVGMPHKRAQRVGCVAVVPGGGAVFRGDEDAGALDGLL